MFVLATYIWLLKVIFIKIDYLNIHKTSSQYLFRHLETMYLTEMVIGRAISLLTVFVKTSVKQSKLFKTSLNQWKLFKSFFDTIG